MSLFGKFGCRYIRGDGETLEYEEEQCVENGEKVNFSNFPLSMGVLYRVATEDGWTDLYSGFQSTLALHGREWQVYLFFCTFFMFGVLVLVNLFIAVILDVFDDNVADMENEKFVASVISWRDQWKEIDQKGHGTMQSADFLRTLIAADAPAGFNGREDVSEEELLERLYDLKLLTSQDFDDVWDDIIESSACSMFVDCYNWLLTCIYTQEELTNLRKSDENAPWVIEYHSAVTAICMRVLTVYKQIDLPITIQKEEEEELIHDWYVTHHVGRPEMLDQLKEKRRLEEIESQKATFVENLLLSDDESDDESDSLGLAKPLSDSEDDNQSRVVE